jgi:hypothetical protein
MPTKVKRTSKKCLFIFIIIYKVIVVIWSKL